MRALCLEWIGQGFNAQFAGAGRQPERALAMLAGDKF
jgi:hypothetical protein